MTSKASLNGLLVAGGVTVAAGVWAAALFIPAPRATAPEAVAASAPIAVAAVADAPAPQAQVAEPAPAPISAPTPVTAPPPVDPAIFGALTADMTPIVAPPRVSMLEAAGAVPIASLSLAATSAHSIGATFAEPLAGSQTPELGGASPLDGPADAGLEEKVAQSELVEPANAPPTPRGKIIVIDASEGTKLDPLRQKNWDLNAVQVIPPMPGPSAPPRR